MNPFEEAIRLIKDLRENYLCGEPTPLQSFDEILSLLDRTLIGAVLKAGKGGEIKATDFTGRVLIDGQGKMKTDTGSMERLEIDDLAAEWEVVEDDTSDQE